MSDDLIDLLLKMLEKDPNKRIELIDIFEHPWITKFKDKERMYEFSSEEISDSSVDEDNDN